MKTRLLLLFFVMALKGFNTAWTGPSVEYAKRPEGLVGEWEVEENIVETAVKLLNINDAEASSAEMVGWAVKKAGLGKPPLLVEEVILFFQVNTPSTNLWATVYLERCSSRAWRKSFEWQKGAEADGMDWKILLPHRPTESDLAAFLHQSNFGPNECHDYRPIHISVYEPFKTLARAASKGISKKEQQRRFISSNRVLWN